MSCLESTPYDSTISGWEPTMRLRWLVASITVECVWGPVLPPGQPVGEEYISAVAGTERQSSTLYILPSDSQGYKPRDSVCVRPPDIKTKGDVPCWDIVWALNGPQVQGATFAMITLLTTRNEVDAFAGYTNTWAATQLVPLTGPLGLPFNFVFGTEEGAMYLESAEMTDYTIFEVSGPE